MVWDALNTLMAWLCETIYSLIAYAYKLFYNIGALRIINSDKIEPIYNSITLILGLIMLFVVIFQLIQYVMEPDNFTDKEKGFGKVMYRMVLSVLMIAFIPNVFDFAFELQKDIMDNHIIENIILGSKDNYTEEWGGIFSSQILGEFYKVNPKVSDHYCTDSGAEGLAAQDIINLNLNDLQKNGEIGALDLCITSKSGEDEKENVIKFDGIIAVLAGGLILWMLVMYCLDLGTRVIQLTYLQIIAPIPIIMYMLPKKDGAFEKWTKQCITTFLDLFVRTAIICFTVLIINTIATTFGDITANISQSSQGDTMFTSLLKVCLILGVMTFAKKAGDMLKELFPKGNAASGELGLSSKNRIPEPAKRVAGAGIGIAAAGTVGLARRAWGNHKYSKQGKEEKDALRRRLNDAQRNYSTQNTIANDTTKSAAERSEARQRATQYKNEIDQIRQQQRRTNWKYNKARMAAATAGGVLVDANKGMVAGLATKGGIGGVAKATKSVLNANSALDEWRENGGTSSISRVVSGVQQSLGINPTERFERTKERIEKENTALSKVTDFYGKAKDAIEKDIDEGKCDMVGTKAREYRQKQVEAERLIAQAGSLKLTDFKYKDAAAKTQAKDEIKDSLKNPQQQRTAAQIEALNTHDRIKYIKNEKMARLAEQYWSDFLATNSHDPLAVSLNGRTLSSLNGNDKTNAIEKILDKLADAACDVEFETTGQVYEAKANETRAELTELKKKAVEEVGEHIVSGATTGGYTNDKAAQYLELTRQAATLGAPNSDILTSSPLTTFSDLSALNKSATTQQNTNSGQLYTLEQDAKYKAAQADKKYNENGKK